GQRGRRASDVAALLPVLTVSRPVSTRNALVLLTDGRFPSGAHPHSAGIEVAVARRAVTDLDDLARFLLGRVHSAGLVDAAFVAWKLGSAARRECTLLV